MRLVEAVRMALGTIRAQKLKSGFSLIGVLIGVTFLIAVVSIVQGMNDYMRDRFANGLIGVNSFSVRRFPSINSGNVPDDTWRDWLRRPRVNYYESAVLRERVKTPTAFARTCFEDNIQISQGTLRGKVEVRAVDAGYFRIKGYDVAAGRTFTEPESQMGATVVVIGDLVREKFFPGIDPLGRQLVIGGLPYRVVGVLAKQGTLFGLSLDRFVAVPFTAPARRELCAENVVHELWGKTAGPDEMKLAVAESQEYMRIARRLKPGQADNFYIQTAEGALGTWEKISRVLMLALPMLVGISLVVGGIVIMNIMLVAVTERTREIGIRKALGARRRDILGQFVVESATLSAAGALLGIGAGLLLAYVVKTVTPLPAAVAPWSIGLAVVLGVAVGVIAGVYPASRAARLDPIVALRSE
ncbi:MAG TPA: ABC transporter permease [Gemmatimonadales bacterium]|nr:ABC transporter permease [Gemmatimonadales bacterium]